MQEGRRVGHHPHLQEVDAIEAIDIDEESDFRLAEAVAEARLSLRT